jgi:hypothetical protein
MHTEVEAQALRCCGPEGCGMTSRSSLAPGRYCIGSHCMAWQWSDTQQNSYEKKRPEGEDWERIGNFWTRTPKARKPYRVGYCGLLNMYR